MAQNRPKDCAITGGISDHKFSSLINGDQWAATWNKIKPDPYFIPATRTTSNKKQRSSVKPGITQVLEGNGVLCTCQQKGDRNGLAWSALQEILLKETKSK